VENKVLMSGSIYWRELAQGIETMHGNFSDPILRIRIVNELRKSTYDFSGQKIKNTVADKIA
jgi:hypothetical protein